MKENFFQFILLFDSLQKSEDKTKRINAEILRLKKVSNNDKNQLRKYSNRANTLARENEVLKLRLRTLSKPENEVNFECEFKETSIDYTCFPKNLKVTNENIILANAIGKHVLKKRSDDVTTVIIEDQTMKYIPKELSRVFPKTKDLIVENSKLSKLNRPPLESLDLRVFVVRKNEIESIAPDTFDDNTELSIIDLSQNDIQKLPDNLFEKLKNLKIVSLSNNKIKSLSVRLIPKINHIEKFIISNNKLQSIDPRITNRLANVAHIDFEKNDCIDMKFDENHQEEKKLALFGKVTLNCADEHQVCGKNNEY